MVFIQRINPEDLPKWVTDGEGRRIRLDDYPFRGDAQERKRLTLQHQLVKLTISGRNYCAPVKGTARILDVACGTCIWGLEVLQKLPEAQLDVLDIDTILFKRYLESLSPEERGHFPFQRFRFIQADARKRLPFENGEYDYTHARFADAFLSRELWPQFLSELIRVTKPDGWVEVVASGFFWFQKPFPAGEDLLNKGIEMTERLNILPDGGSHLLPILQEMGVTKIQSRVDIVGRSASQRTLLRKDLVTMLRVGKPVYCQKMGLMSEADFDAKLAAFEREGEAYGLRMRFHRVWFQPKNGSFSNSGALGSVVD